ncbi:MAG: Tfp pilus assembly protein FimT/FimU [Aquificaceae bacterium]
MDRKVKGYTVMEILVVMAIVAILGSFAFLWLRNLILNQRLKATTDNLVSLLNTARIYSITGRNGELWGVYINNETYTLFRDENRNCVFDNGEEVKTYQTERGVRVDNPLVLVFDKKGYPRNAICGLGAGHVVVNSEALGKAKTICISRYGRIRVVEGSSCQ